MWNSFKIPVSYTFLYISVKSTKISRSGKRYICLSEKVNHFFQPSIICHKFKRGTTSSNSLVLPLSKRASKRSFKPLQSLPSSKKLQQQQFVDRVVTGEKNITILINFMHEGNKVSIPSNNRRSYFCFISESVKRKTKKIKIIEKG